jgi:hypothetical protein
VINWEKLPRPYPLGLYLYHAPAALLYEYSGLTFGAINVLMLAQYLLFAHLLLFFVARDLWRAPASENAESWRLLVGFVVFPMLYLQIQRWTLAGFYDAIVAAFLWLALRAQFREQNPSRALLFFGGALFLGYRALWFFPLVLFAARDLWRTRAKGTSRREGAAIASAAVLVGISLWGLALYFPGLAQHGQNNLVYWRRFFEPDARPLAFLVPASILLAYLASDRHRALLAFCGSITAFALLTVQTGGWHALAAIPLFALPALMPRHSTRAPVAVVFFHLLTSAHAFRNNPLSGILVSETLKDLRRAQGADLIRDD